MTSQSSTVLLTRLLSLRENSPFLLVLDSLAQSSRFLVDEVGHRCASNKIIYLSYETLNAPSYVTDFIDCTSHSTADIVEQVKKIPSSPSKSLIIVDSLNYIPSEELTQFVTGMIQPSFTLLGVFHTNCPQPQSNVLNYPSPISLLSYIASSIFEVEPFSSKIDPETLDNKLARFEMPINVSLNSPIFKLALTNRRKSGRSIKYLFKIDSTTHVYEIHKETVEENDPEDDELLKDLTTFNLTTNSKQKLAREQVELPFMQAQDALGSSGGAIVYEYEKDDDYDEEDPYEDPF